MNISEVDLHKLTVSDPFLGQYQQLVRDVVIPYQWDALNDRIPEADFRRVNFTGWCFRTATSPNGWKR